MKPNEPKRSPRRRDDDWDARVERRLRADLDAFLADADAATFVFSDSEPLATARRELAETSRSTKTRFRRLIAASTGTVALGLLVALSTGVFNASSTPRPQSQNEFRKILTLGGGGSYHAANLALSYSEKLAAEPLRRVESWRDDATNAVRSGVDFEKVGAVVDSELAATNGGIGAVLKNDPIFRIIGEIYRAETPTAETDAESAVL